MATEAEVQLLSEGTGPKIGTFESDRPRAVDTSGNAQADQTINVQAVAISDGEGDELSDPNVMLGQIRDLLVVQNELLTLIAGALGG